MKRCQRRWRANGAMSRVWGLTLIINEEGKLLGMPVNRLATDMAYLFNDVIVGNAILIGTTDEDFIGLTKEAAENIVEKWG